MNNGNYLISNQTHLCKESILSFLENSKQFNQLRDGKVQNKNQAVFGLNGSSDRSFIMAGLIRDHKSSICILTDTKKSADLIAEDLCFFLPDEEIVSYHCNERDRLSVLSKLLKKQKIITIVTVELLMDALVKPDVFEKAFLTLEVGQQVDIEEIKYHLNFAGYEREDNLEKWGQFCIRGGIIDIYPPESRLPVRIELFGDEIESIYLFDLNKKKIIDRIQLVSITPASGGIVDNQIKNTAKTKLQTEYDEHLKHLHTISVDAYHQLKAQVHLWIDKIDTDERIRELLPFFYSDLASFLDYLPDDALIFFDDVRQINDAVKTTAAEKRDKHQGEINLGRRLPLQAKMNVEWGSICSKLKDFTNVLFSCLPLGKSDYNAIGLQIHPNDVINITSKPVPSFCGRINLMAEEIKSWNKSKNVMLVLNTTKSAGGLVEQLKQYEIEAFLKGGKDLNIRRLSDDQIKKIIAVVGKLNFGFELASANLVIVTEKEILSSKILPKGIAKHKKGIAIEALKEGDYVVHLHHGIGRYEGIMTLELDGIKRDYILVKYAGEDKIYVPLDQMNLLQHYVGNEDVKPKLSKIGSGEWARAKSRARKATREIAEDLIELYAKRQKTKGYAFSKDTVWQAEFEQRFPFKETPDQLKAIEEVKRDMESSKPMDRLICGDVGYGKTEVALRAAFKAVNDEKQVAVLVPTTVLAQQHYRTFCERFAGFPVKIEVISRLKSHKTQQKILLGVKSGNVDIIIGTHRLLQRDVQFKDLGLLIIDEEQRFGVSHKEKLKKMRVGVDVLTLTATPIPRTLHMSLVGIKDTSLLETPPENRLPVQTYVLEEGEDLIKEAIQNEIDRGGQVFFVHNKIEELKEIVFKLKKLIPDAKISMAHGRMQPMQLEKIMVDFVNGEYNMLVCTTIIENGLDLPNANTLIVKDAENFGLAQLYQLRGRVGRSTRQAYAYFIFNRDKVLSEIAEKRLLAIKEFTDFGSGYKIAMRDLQLRGAGNLLGARQHGHIVEIGFDLYCSMLEQAIKEVKGEQIEEKVNTTIEMPVDAYIPDEYISDEEQKVELYHYIASADSEEEINKLENELKQHFRDIPDPLKRLLLVAFIRVLASEAKVKQVIFEKGYFNFVFDNVLLDMAVLLEKIKNYHNRVKFIKNDEGFEIKLKSEKLHKIRLKELEELVVFLACIKESIIKKDNEALTSNK